ncbi:hypothetical protein ACLOJK_008903 [Asimina triloba]
MADCDRIIVYLAIMGCFGYIVNGSVAAIGKDMTAVILSGNGGDFSNGFEINNHQKEEAPHGAPKQNY